jgi:hypothetical protein
MKITMLLPKFTRPSSPAKRNIIVLLLALGVAGFAGQLQAQTIDNTTPYSFTTEQATIYISGTNLLTEAYGGSGSTGWVLSPGMFGNGFELEYATSSANG